MGGRCGEVTILHSHHARRLPADHGRLPGLRQSRISIVLGAGVVAVCEIEMSASKRAEPATKVRRVYRTAKALNVNPTYWQIVTRGAVLGQFHVLGHGRTRMIAWRDAASKLKP